MYIYKMHKNKCIYEISPYIYIYIDIDLIPYDSHFGYIALPTSNRSTKTAPGLLEVTWTDPSVLSAATTVCTSGSNVHGEWTKSEEPIKLMW